MKLFLIFLICCNSAFSLTKTQDKSKVAVPKNRLSTNVRFEDHLINGKYQNAFEAVSTVENDKDIDDLIGTRKSFQDRIKKSEGMR